MIGKIEANNVNFWYGDFHALKGISMSIEERSVVAFIGPSGCGKSTFLRLFNRMNDLIPNTRLTGEIHIDGKDIYGKDVQVDELRKKVGMVFQRPNPFPKSIFENVAYGLRVNGVTDNSFIRQRVEESLRGAALWEEVKDKLKVSAYALSGGQQQRVGIAAALVTSPRLIIADEPTTALDSITQRQIVDLLASLVDDSGASMLFITHDFAVLNHATTRCYVLADGRVAESGQTADILQSPHTKVASQLVTSARALSLRIDAETK